jgi:hypothetical protein
VGHRRVDEAVAVGGDRDVAGDEDGVRAARAQPVHGRRALVGVASGEGDAPAAFCDELSGDGVADAPRATGEDGDGPPVALGDFGHDAEAIARLQAL